MAHRAAGIVARFQRGRQRAGLQRRPRIADALRPQAQGDLFAGLDGEFRPPRRHRCAAVGERQPILRDGLHVHLDQVRLADEARREPRLRVFVDLLRRADLLKLPLAHDRDAVGHVQRLFLIVRDVDKRDAQPLLDVLQLLLHLLAQLQIQRADRIEHDGARDGHALALAAGELARHPLFVALELHQSEHLGHAPLPFRLLDAADAKPIGDVLFDVHVGKQRIILKDGVHIALFRNEVRNIAPVERHRAGVGRKQPGDDAKRGRLAAAGRAEQRDKFAGLYVQRDPAKNLGSFNRLFKARQPQQRVVGHSHSSLSQPAAPSKGARFQAHAQGRHSPLGEFSGRPPLRDYR